MRRLFADTFYWGALFHQHDSGHERVLAFSLTLTPGDRLWTTDAVLAEVLAMFGGAGAYLRQGAARRVRALLADARVVLIPWTHDLFLEGFALYEQRPDKSYSLTDDHLVDILRGYAFHIAASLPRRKSTAATASTKSCQWGSFTS